MQDNAELTFQEMRRQGRALAEGRWRKLCGDLLQKDEEKAIMTAILLENERKGLDRLDEDVKMLNVGSFDRFAFPMIRAIYPNLVSTELVSVQPMQGPTSMIFYMDTRYAVTKGSAVAGQTSLSPLEGHTGPKSFTSELIDHETLVTVAGTDDTPTIPTIGWLPIRPGSFYIYATVAAATVTGHDNGNGLITGTGIDSGTIDYTTGAVAIDYTTAPDNPSEIWCTYRYVSEGNTQRPELDIILTSAVVLAETQSLVTNWSVESEQDFRAVHGIDAQVTLMSEIAENIRFEIDREIVNDLWTLSGPAVDVTWDYTPPTGIDFYRHQLTFVNALVQASNVIFQRTRGKGRGNWMVCGTNVSTVIEVLPQFVSADYGDAEGVVYIGQLGSLKIYKDPWFETDYALMGYKGSTWLRAGYVYAPYVPLWRTPIVTLTDIKRRVGMMTRYGKKTINDKYYVKIYVDNFGVMA